MVERTLIRYAAVACVVAGGMLMSGTGAVAVADETGNDGAGTRTTTADAGTQTVDTGTQTVDTGTKPGGVTLPRTSPISPPVMILPSRLAPSTLPEGTTGPFTSPSFTMPGRAASTLPSADTAGKKPAGQQPSVTLVEPDNSQPAVGVIDNSASLEQTSPSLEQTGSSSSSTPKSPTISLVPLVPPGVPMGPPITIKNPLRDLLPIKLDQPILPQLLPPPLVLLLNAIAQHVPLADLLIEPLMSFEVPTFITDVLLSDIVVPTLPLGAMFHAAAVPTGLSLSNPTNWSSPASDAPPPAELAPMGMDMPQEPAPEPGPTRPPAVVDQPQRPNPPPDNSVSPLSEPVAFRAGYSDYLRNAGVAQITAIAVPGAVAILLFSVGGGFIGYRQARAGHVIRAKGIARFLR